MKAELIKIFIIAAMIAVLLGATYKWVDDKGNVHYTDNPPEREKTQKIGIEPGPSQKEVDEAQFRAEKIRRAEEVLRQSREFTELKDERRIQAAHREEHARKIIQLGREFGGEWSVYVDLELQCQEKYNMSCDDMLGWKTRAIEKCNQEHGTGSDCSNDYYLRRFKPVSIEQQRQIGIQRRARER
jgi:hypothetical protein